MSTVTLGMYTYSGESLLVDLGSVGSTLRPRVINCTTIFFDDLFLKFYLSNLFSPLSHYFFSTQYFVINLTEGLVFDLDHIVLVIAQ